MYRPLGTVAQAFEQEPNIYDFFMHDRKGFILAASSSRRRGVSRKHAEIDTDNSNTDELEIEEPEA